MPSGSAAVPSGFVRSGLEISWPFLTATAQFLILRNTNSTFMQQQANQGHEIDMRELERQLSRPTGETGREVANMMNETNSGMILNTIESLRLRDHHVILELGHGNGRHLNDLMTRAQGLKYAGLELSETMFKEAQKINRDLLDHHEISFALYDGIHLPFKDHTFDRMLTVNTLYFWSDPEALLNEIGRVLKPDGYAVITYAQKKMMKKLPFVGEVFRLYDDNDIAELVGRTSMRLVDIVARTEQVKTKSGELVPRSYAMAIVESGRVTH